MRLILGFVDRCVLLASILFVASLTGFPAQLSQYVVGRLAQVSEDIAGFQEVADRYFEGNLESLVQHHLQSGDPVFRDEAEPLAMMLESKSALEDVYAALNGNLFDDTWVILTEVDSEMIEHVWAHYEPTMGFGSDSLFFALGVGGLFWFMWLGLVFLVSWPFREN